MRLHSAMKTAGSRDGAIDLKHTPALPCKSSMIGIEIPRYILLITFAKHSGRTNDLSICLRVKSFNKSAQNVQKIGNSRCLLM